MRTEDWLSSYQDLDGVAQTLLRISRRLRKPVSLEAAILLPDSTMLALHDDFSAFYADLQRHVVEFLTV
jgi:acyl carrier protein phosphodiesterase